MFEDQVSGILARHAIVPNKVEHVKSTKTEHLFYIDDDYVLRVMENNPEHLIKKIERIRNLDYVQKILYQGSYASSVCFNYLIFNKLHGVDFIDAVPAMSNLQSYALGTGISDFLCSLHANHGSYYDIGHYIPILSKFSGTWENGHRLYWEYMVNELKKIEHSASESIVYDEAFNYLECHRDALSQQSGPVLLHNDLHPKNIIVKDGVFSGVIDWECSQYGEPDFEYCHFIHWCIFPPDPQVNLKPFLGSLLKKSNIQKSYEYFATRQTIYQIEHEIMQIIWSRGKAQSERIPKIRAWLEGELDSLLDELKGD